MTLPSNWGPEKGSVVRRGTSELTEADRPTALAVPEDAPSAPPEPEVSPIRMVVAGAVQAALIGAIVLAGITAYGWILGTAPTAERKARERVARLVEVVPAQLAQRGPVVEAWGEVVAAQTLVVRPEIAGTLEWVHPDLTEGGRLTAGDVVARFDSRDLRLAIMRAEADIADIEARKRIEAGQAAIGERELTRLSRNLTDAQRELVLRKPQMAQLDAELISAKATLEQAENALARTEVKVPFDAIVIDESVAPGSMLAMGGEAATLVAADRFNVVLAVPAAALERIDVAARPVVSLSQPGVWPAGTERSGHIIRVGSALSETGRMAEMIAEVPKPLDTDPASGAPRLLLGSFVRGLIETAPIPGAVVLDRSLIRDGDTVWVMNADDELEVRRLNVAWRGPERALITEGLSAGDRVVTTPLASFAPGMALRTRAEPSG